jgi:hypothetical protein
MHRWQVFIVIAALGLAGAARAGVPHYVRSADASSDTTSKPASTEPPPYQPVQFPMPPESSMNSGDTNVVGSSDTWFGTISITSSSGMDSVHQYYDVALPSQGWVPLSALMTSDKVVLQYVNKHLGRAAIVTLTSKSLWRGTDIEVVVSPLIDQAGHS